MAAATSIVPFQPPTGLSASQALAHALDHIGKAAKKHDILKRENLSLQQQFRANDDEWQETAKQHFGTIVEMLMSGAGGAAMGFANARWGGGKDHATVWGVPVDASSAIASHIGGILAGYLIDDEMGQFIARGLHALGNLSLGVVTYRLSYQKGHELWGGAPAAAGAPQANGVKGGTVYAAPAQPAHK